MLEKEAVRLVIWDLDETFWKGTLSEGGIQEYIQAHHDTVIELAKRGIISSICSKNEHQSVETVLREKNLWDYFILPSIDWSPKGPRLKALIEDIQLRPESVLFIDDNVSNREEAKAHIPGLQIADESIIASLLNHPLLKGKDDSNLERLKQYQLLQRRKQDEKAAGNDNTGFLRASNIHVSIEPNIAAHLDRAIELINRTNQLNFTKSRLPEDQTAAKQELLHMTSRYFNQAGLIRVWDNYGDYGYCGLYIVHTLHHTKRLLQFCFSCRILGMGVERWLYQKLGRPDITISGDVQSDLKAEGEIDWINQDLNGAMLFSEGDGSTALPATHEILQFTVPAIRLRGGCELDALSHYLRQETSDLRTHTNYTKGAFILRQDSTINTALGLSPLSNELKQELDALALDHQNFDGHIFDAPPAGSFFILSTWGDLYLPIYRHKTMGFDVSLAFIIWGEGLYDLTRATVENLQKYFDLHRYKADAREHAVRVINHLRENYVFVGALEGNKLYHNWQNILRKIPSNCTVAILLPNCHRGQQSVNALQYHSILRDAAKDFPNVFLLDTTPYINKQEDQQDALDHLDRMVYFNIYKDLMQEVARRNLLAAAKESQPT